jgi:prenyltransferase beta subunit
VNGKRFQFQLRQRRLISFLPFCSVISTFSPLQNSTGGFGGGHGQMSHCASTYACILSLAMVGGDEAFKLVDRQAM